MLCFLAIIIFLVSISPFYKFIFFTAVYCCFYYICSVYTKFIGLFVVVVRRRDFKDKIKLRLLISVEKLISLYELDPLNRSAYGKARYSYGSAISHRYSSFQVWLWHVLSRASNYISKVGIKNVRIIATWFYF